MWEELKAMVIDQFQNNQMFSGAALFAFLTSAIGTLAYYLKDIPMQIWDRIYRKIDFVVTSP